MSQVGNRLGRAVAVVGLLGAAALANAGPAAAVSCYGDYCSGRDPMSTGCAADAYTVASTHIPGTWTSIELRWSPTCKANWARVPASWRSAPPNGLSAQQSTGYTQRVIAISADFAWTGMIYSPVKCVAAVWTGSPGGAATACV